MAVAHNRGIFSKPGRTAVVRLIAPVIVLAAMLAFCLTGSSCKTGTGSTIDDVADAYHFSILEWEIEAVSREFDDWLFGQDVDIREDRALVTEYFNNRQRMGTLDAWMAAAGDGLIAGDVAAWQDEYSVLEHRNGEIIPLVEKVIAAQTEDVLRELGLINPVEIASDTGLFFPPVGFVIQPPPHLLVVSPRDEISRLRDITLVQVIEEEAKEDIEAAIDRLGLSGLVVRLGGIATYPAFVSDNLSLMSTLEVVIEEWFHQYMFFRPLGLCYALHLAGIQPDYEIATANEALAGIVSREAAQRVAEKYYPELLEPAPAVSGSGAEFDFYAEMRSIRLHVDGLLEQGRIDQAESYMQERRRFLASQGYIIRKINQAYFAFYGTYADSPGSVSPIGAGLRIIREQSQSLTDFVDTVSYMTGVGDIVGAAS